MFLLHILKLCAAANVSKSTPANEESVLVLRKSDDGSAIHEMKYASFDINSDFLTNDEKKSIAKLQEISAFNGVSFLPRDITSIDNPKGFAISLDSKSVLTKDLTDEKMNLLHAKALVSNCKDLSRLRCLKATPLKIKDNTFKSGEDSLNGYAFGNGEDELFAVTYKNSKNESIRGLLLLICDSNTTPFGKDSHTRLCIASIDKDNVSSNIELISFSMALCSQIELMLVSRKILDSKKIGEEKFSSSTIFEKAPAEPSKLVDDLLGKNFEFDESKISTTIKAISEGFFSYLTEHKFLVGCIAVGVCATIAIVIFLVRSLSRKTIE